MRDTVESMGTACEGTYIGAGVDAPRGQAKAEDLSAVEVRDDAVYGVVLYLDPRVAPQLVRADGEGAAEVEGVARHTTIIPALRSLGAQSGAKVWTDPATPPHHKTETVSAGKVTACRAEQ